LAFVVFAGQSNALGFGMRRETLPAEYAQIDWWTWIWNNDTGGFQVMVPGFNTGTANNPQAWGPEVAFAHQFHQEHPGEILFIVKSAKGSTSLAQNDDGLDWSPTSQGELFDLTAERVGAARQFLGDMAVDAVFIVQGEQDGFDPDAAAVYGENLTAWLNAIRHDWMGRDDGRVAFAQIADTHEGFHAVREAQAAVDAADPFAASIDAGYLPLQADGLHYAAEGFLQIGQGFYSLFDDWA
jgi:hypothetical protein